MEFFSFQLSDSMAQERGVRWVQKNTPFENRLPFLLTHSLTEHVFLNLHILNKQITFFLKISLLKLMRY